MFDQLPLWALWAGFIVSIAILARVAYKALYAATVYMVKRMQDEGEIPEMTKLVDLEEKVDAMGVKVDQTRAVLYELEHTVTNGLSTKAKESRDWQLKYGPRIDRMIGTMTEHLRNSD
jgi:hypothetical protein